MRSMRVLVAVVFTVGMLAAGTSAASGGGAFRTWVACSHSAQAPASHECDRNDDKAAFFRSRSADVTYKVCVKFPNDTKLCANHQNGPEDQTRRNVITSTRLGRHIVTWFVGGEQVGRFRFDVTN